VVLDFDGTLTDADQHAHPFQRASQQELGRRLGLNAEQILSEWDRAETAIKALSDGTAWEVGGYPVCPARADPYLIANSITRLLLEEHRMAMSPEERRAIVHEVHRTAYHQELPPFRPQARIVLEALLELGLGVHVVTNSQTDTVSSLLEALKVRDGERIRVHGNANKFCVGPSASKSDRFIALGASIDLAPVGRPMHLQRGCYFDVLQEIWKDTGTGPDSMMVAGDNFELDLAVPAALGAHVHLVLRAGTLRPEQLAVQALKRGAQGSVDAVLDRIESPIHRR
jgi:phosphoglycolate phosphatase-like HAD superfamily hydrolase